MVVACFVDHRFLRESDNQSDSRVGSVSPPVLFNLIFILITVVLKDLMVILKYRIPFIRLTRLFSLRQSRLVRFADGRYFTAM